MKRWRGERGPGEARDKRDARRPGDPRDERDERVAGDKRDGMWQWLAARPIIVTLIFAAAVSVIGYGRMDQIVKNNERDRNELIDKIEEARLQECMQRNEAWDRVMGFVLTVSEDDEAVETLRRIGLVDCEGE